MFKREPLRAAATARRPVVLCSQRLHPLDRHAIPSLAQPGVIRLAPDDGRSEARIQTPIGGLGDVLLRSGYKKSGLLNA